MSKDYLRQQVKQLLIGKPTTTICYIPNTIKFSDILELDMKICGSFPQPDIFFSEKVEILSL